MPIAKLPAANLNYLDILPSVPNAADTPIFLLHGFSSSIRDNWAETGWVDYLNEAGLRVIAIDHRGHGESQKFYARKDYSLDLMARDAVDLLDYLGVKKAHLLGYSMGSRIATKIAINHPEHVAKLVLGGNGYGMISGTGDWAPVHDGLLATSMDDISDLRARAFRRFAERTGSDKQALAACIMGNRDTFSESDFASIKNETLIAIGSEDDIAGSGEKLANIMQNAEFFSIPNRDHMRASTDKAFKQAVLDFVTD